MFDYLTPKAREHFERCEIDRERDGDGGCVCICGLCELLAALPALEQQIREQVAQEIEAARPEVHQARRGGKATHYAMTYAAQIARGMEQP